MRKNSWGDLCNFVRITLLSEFDSSACGIRFPLIWNPLKGQDQFSTVLIQISLGKGKKGAFESIAMSAFLLMEELFISSCQEAISATQFWPFTEVDTQNCPRNPLAHIMCHFSRQCLGTVQESGQPTGCTQKGVWKQMQYSRRQENLKVRTWGISSQLTSALKTVPGLVRLLTLLHNFCKFTLYFFLGGELIRPPNKMSPTNETMPDWLM